MSRRGGALLAAVLALVAGAPALGADVKGVLARLAKAQSPETREAIGVELLELGAPVEAELLEALPALPPEAAGVALSVLGELATPNAAAALLKAARSPEEPRRQAAADHLPQYSARPEVVDALLLLCRDQVEEIALAAAGGLRATGPQAAWEGLLELVKISDDPPRPLTLVAAEGLARLLGDASSKERVEQLLAAARMSDGPPRRLLLETLGEGGAPAAPALLGLLEVAWEERLLDDEVHAEVTDLLGELTDEVTPELREVAVRGLGRLAAADALAARAVVRSLTDPSARVRRVGIRFLPMPDEAAPRLDNLARLVEMLVDPDDDLRRAAHARLVREAKERLPLSQLEWSAWLARQRELVKKAAAEAETEEP